MKFIVFIKDNIIGIYPICKCEQVNIGEDIVTCFVNDKPVCWVDKSVFAYFIDKDHRI